MAADIGITGIPSIFSMPLISIEPELPTTSSIILSARTIGTSISKSCIVRYMFLSILVASTILIIAFGFSLSTKFLETISSLLYGDIEYIPGKSVTDVFSCPLIIPLLQSTVTPGKFPTCWLEPVS